MIAVQGFANQPVGVFGLGQSGISVARSLAEGGAHVSAWDDNPSQREFAAAAGISLDDLYVKDFGDLAALVLSPGVPLTHPKPHHIVRRAQQAACEVIGDVELFAQCRLPARVIGVTGTNGKSTTTALIGHMLRAFGQRVAVGGNLGIPVLDLPPLRHDGVYALELSSFQLDLTRSLICDVAVLLNLGLDHLDRHGDMSTYAAVKKSIFSLQQSHHTAIIGLDDEHTESIYRDLAKLGTQRLIPIAVGREVEGGVYVIENRIYDAINNDVVQFDLKEVHALRGEHNWQNAAAAVAALRALGLPIAAATESVRNFCGLAHRMEEIGLIGGVRFVNDSKATNVAAASRALAYYENIYWIAGGRAKQENLDSLVAFFPHIAHAFLVGEATDYFSGLLEGKVPFTRAGDLAVAVNQAISKATSSLNYSKHTPVVLLSPACASHDQWSSFEARGDAFRAQVEALAGSLT